MRPCQNEPWNNHVQITIDATLFVCEWDQIRIVRIRQMILCCMQNKVNICRLSDLKSMTCNFRPFPNFTLELVAVNVDLAACTIWQYHSMACTFNNTALFQPNCICKFWILIKSPNAHIDRCEHQYSLKNFWKLLTQKTDYGFIWLSGELPIYL